MAHPVECAAGLLQDYVGAGEEGVGRKWMGRVKRSMGMVVREMGRNRN